MAKTRGANKDGTYIIGYTRVSTKDQNGEHQRHEINEYARKQGFIVDEYIMVEMSSRKSLQARRIEELKEKLKTGDTLIATEMSRIGRSSLEVLGIIENFLLPQKINFIFIKENIVIMHGKMTPVMKLTIEILLAMAGFERSMISQRTIDALDAIRASGVKLGKPRGLVQRSKLDQHVEQIKALLKADISLSGIARYVGSSRTNLGKYLKNRPAIQREVRDMMAAHKPEKRR